MPPVHGRYGRIQQSFEGVISALHVISDQGGNDLTYVENYPPCRAHTFGNVYGAQICRIGDDGENFTLKTDWGAIVVFGFAGFAADLSKSMTGERLGVRKIAPLFFMRNGR